MLGCSAVSIESTALVTGGCRIFKMCVVYLILSFDTREESRFKVSSAGLFFFFFFFFLSFFFLCYYIHTLMKASMCSAPLAEVSQSVSCFWNSSAESIVSLTMVLLYLYMLMKAHMCSAPLAELSQSVSCFWNSSAESIVSLTMVLLYLYMLRKAHMCSAPLAELSQSISCFWNGSESMSNWRWFLLYIHAQESPYVLLVYERAGKPICAPPLSQKMIFQCHWVAGSICLTDWLALACPLSEGCGRWWSASLNMSV